MKVEAVLEAPRNISGQPKVPLQHQISKHADISAPGTYMFSHFQLGNYVLERVEPRVNTFLKCKCEFRHYARFCRPFEGDKTKCRDSCNICKIRYLKFLEQAHGPPAFRCGSTVYLSRTYTEYLTLLLRHCTLRCAHRSRLETRTNPFRHARFKTNSETNKQNFGIVLLFEDIEPFQLDGHFK